MGPIAAIQTCLAKYFHLQGRAGRPEYWWFYLFVVIATGLAALVDGLIFGFETTQEPGNHPITLVVAFVTFFPLLAAGWRRMHDTGRPGWYVILPQIVLAAGFVVLFIGIFGFAAIERVAGVEPERLRGPASVIGVAGAVALYLAALAAAIVKLWWLVRPGEEGTNAFGPPPVYQTPASGGAA